MPTKRLFTVRTRTGGSIVDMNTGTIDYFADKGKAKFLRDQLNAIDNNGRIPEDHAAWKYFITLGPDHFRYQA